MALYRPLRPLVDSVRAAARRTVTKRAQACTFGFSLLRNLQSVCRLRAAWNGRRWTNQRASNPAVNHKAWMDDKQLKSLHLSWLTFPYLWCFMTGVQTMFHRYRLPRELGYIWNKLSSKQSISVLAGWMCVFVKVNKFMVSRLGIVPVAVFKFNIYRRLHLLILFQVTSWKYDAKLSLKLAQNSLRNDNKILHLEAVEERKNMTCKMLSLLLYHRMSSLSSVANIPTQLF